MWVLGPRIEGRPNDALLNVREAGSLQQLPGVCLVFDGLAGSPRRVFKVIVPLERRGLGQGPVIATRLKVNLDVLDMSLSGFEMPGGGSVFGLRSLDMRETNAKIF